MDRNQVPHFLEASTKEELVQLMRAMNKRHSQRFHYFDFGFAKGKFYCWFEIKRTELLKDKLNG